VDAENGAAVERLNPMADTPRTFEEVAVAQDAADRERLERAKRFMDPTREVKMIEDQARDWRVAYFDRDGAGYVTIFAGPEAERRARDYFRTLRLGAVKIVRESTKAN
jgi:hypothetical protein